MERFYLKKFYSFFISLILFLSLFVSCSLSLEEEGGSISFTLPSNPASMTRAPVSETPESFSIMLYQGKSGNYRGKNYDGVHKSGDKVLIKGLKPVEHTLIVKGESDNFLFENSKIIQVKLKRTPITISLQKKEKAKVTFDLSSFSCPPDTTFSYSIKDSRNKVIVENNNVPFASSIVVPYSLVEGQYSVNFSSSISNIEQYIVNNDNTFTVSSSMTPLTLNIDVRPLQTFYVSSNGTISGTGSEKNPFNSLKKAVDAVIQNFETSDDALIIVDGTITDATPIIMDGHKNIEIRGKTPSCVINGNLILDGPSLTLNNFTLNSNTVDSKALVYKNGNLTLGTTTSPQAYITSILYNSLNPIKIGSNLDSSISAPSSEISMSNISEKTIFTSLTADSLEPSFIAHYNLNDPLYLINENGKIEKVPEQMTEVYIELDSLMEGKQLELKISNDGVPPSVISIDPINGKRIKKLLEIGNTYYLSVNDKQSHASYATSKITVDSDKNKNKVSLYLIKEYYVNNERGDDLLNFGYIESSPFKTFSRALEAIKEKQTVSKNNIYKIYVDGVVYNDTLSPITLSDNLEVTVVGDKSKECEVNGTITVPRTSKLNLQDLIVGKVCVNDGTVLLSGTASSNNKVFIREINLETPSSFVTVQSQLYSFENRCKVTIPDTCTKAIDFTSTPQGLLFESTREDLVIKEDGTVVPPNVTVKLDRVPESGRFTLSVREDSLSPALLTIPLTKQETPLPIFLKTLSPSVYYTIDINDNYNYGELSNRMCHDPSTPICEIPLERKLVIGGAGATDLDNNGAKPFMTIGGALAVAQDTNKFDNSIPWEILLDGATPYEVNSTNSITINTPVTVKLKGVNGKATINLDYRNGPGITVTNANASLQLENVLVYKYTYTSPSPAANPIDVINGRLELLDNYSDDAFVGSYIHLTEQGVLYIKNYSCKPKDSITIDAGHTTTTPIVIGNNFFDFDLDTFTKFITVNASTVGTKIIEKEDKTSPMDYANCFHMYGSKYINESGEIATRTTVNYTIKDANGISIPTLSTDGYKIMVEENTFGVSSYYNTTSTNITAETGSFKISPLLDYLVKIKDKNSNIIYEYEIKKGSAPSTLNIKLFEYYVSDNYKEGKDISKNHGSSLTSPIDFNRAISMVNYSNGTPSVIKVMSENLLQHEERTRKAAILNSKCNLTITNDGTTEAVIYSTRGTDYNDVNEKGIVIPFLVINDPNANVTFTNITIGINDSTAQKVGTGALICQNGTVTLGSGAKLATRGLNYTSIAIESGGKLNIGPDFPGTRSSKILLHNTTGTFPKIKLTGALRPDIKVNVGVARNEAFDFMTGATIVDFSATGVDGMTEASKFIMTNDSFDPVPNIGVDKAGMIISQP